MAFICAFPRSTFSRIVSNSTGNPARIWKSATTHIVITHFLRTYALHILPLGIWRISTTRVCINIWTRYWNLVASRSDTEQINKNGSREVFVVVVVVSVVCTMTCLSVPPIVVMCVVDHHDSWFMAAENEHWSAEVKRNRRPMTVLRPPSSLLHTEFKWHNIVTSCG